jgi:hypothetical protein
MAAFEDPKGDLLSSCQRIMSGALKSLSPHDISIIQPFADDEGTPSELSMLALAVVEANEKREMQMQRAKEEEEASNGIKRSLTTSPDIRRNGTRSFYIVDSLLKLGKRLDADKEVAQSGFKEGEEGEHGNTDIMIK